MPKHRSIAEKLEADRQNCIAIIEHALEVEQSVLTNCYGATLIKHQPLEPKAEDTLDAGDILSELQDAIKAVTQLRNISGSDATRAVNKRKLSQITPMYERLAKTLQLSAQLIELLEDDAGEKQEAVARLSR